MLPSRTNRKKRRRSRVDRLADVELDKARFASASTARGGADRGRILDSKAERTNLHGVGKPLVLGFPLCRWRGSGRSEGEKAVKSGLAGTSR